eukprot:1012832-Prorocentrum_minimum.AAC.1
MWGHVADLAPPPPLAPRRCIARCTREGSGAPAAWREAGREWHRLVIGTTKHHLVIRHNHKT